MPTNIFSAVVLSFSWLTNHPPVAEGPRGAVWHQTNIVSFRTVVAVVGPGIPALIYTNAPVAVNTNVKRFEIVESVVADPVVSMVVTSQWPSVSGRTNGKIFTAAEAAAKGLPALPNK